MQEGRSGAGSFLARKRPEIAAGGYARDDAGVAFFQRVNALVEPEWTVIDLGAGRGEQLQGCQNKRKRLLRLQGKADRVVGLDVDDAIMHHPFLDERHVITIGESWPLADASADMIVSDWVLEHVGDPAGLVAEAHRVLKPGGWFCAHTPNKWSYVGLFAQLIPNSLHDTVLKRMWPDRKEQDIFPTVYRMNTLADLRRHFDGGSWDHFSYHYNSMPKYHGNSSILFNLIGLFTKLAPRKISTDLMVFIRKKSGN